ncbi:RraA-like protein [Aspergillus sclerotioniger CBS 115572]|uniref:RraA-like protein n=1 Tax=Aspergillus sclerotioniger CBS 115572 TaxID=1450535 RepID=A0A317WPW5_9EURO|nr:RraA-like protein [Aspergillus sclerotioniger CBS 115572]PWY87312.1 RraA-like protein [Aspergillus sclerotioniger CBS 115572]
MTTLEEKIALLHNYSACDVSDALLKLQPVAPNTAPRAGYLADLTLHPPNLPATQKTKTIAPATTLTFHPKYPSPTTAPNAPSSPTPTPSPIPPQTHWSDLTTPNTILIITQPNDQHCAVVGGIMAQRMKYRGVSGVVVSGRVRDMAELRASGLSIWARGVSTVGSAAETVPGGFGGVVDVGGDIIFCDPEEGVVAIPSELLDRVLEVMPKLVAMDERVKGAVAGGVSVFEAFREFRTKI